MDWELYEEKFREARSRFREMINDGNFDDLTTEARRYLRKGYVKKSVAAIEKYDREVEEEFLDQLCDVVATHEVMGGRKF